MAEQSDDPLGMGGPDETFPRYRAASALEQSLGRTIGKGRPSGIVEALRLRDRTGPGVPGRRPLPVLSLLQGEKVEKPKDEPLAKKAPEDLVSPIIAPLKLTVVVKKFAKNAAGKTEAYTKPKRQKVTLSTNAAFDGKGTFTRSGDAIKFFKSTDKNDEIKFDGSDNVFEGKKLSSGVTLYAEGAKPSAAIDDVKLTLKLSGGSKKIGPDAVNSATSVELTLDICSPQVASGADPPPMSTDDKIGKGRAVVEQNKDGTHERALLIIRPVKPAGYKGDLVLKATNGRVAAFLGGAGPGKVDPFTVPAGGVPATGFKLWAEGVGASDDLRDTGFQLGIKGVEDDGDHVHMTVVKLVLDICKSRSKKPEKNVEPDPMSVDDRTKVGRFLHEQIGDHHGRALLVVRAVKPKAFDGKLVLKAIDPAKTELFKNEVAKSGDVPIPGPKEFDLKTEKHEDKKFWVQGKAKSAKLRDAGYLLFIKEHPESDAEKAVVTVCKFSKLVADIPSTPAVTNRAGNSPVNRHEWKIADPAATANHFNEDYTLNKPIVLLENSVRATDQVKLSVKVEPADVPVRWAVIRDRRPAPDGDHKDVIGLKDNKEAPTLAKNVETLANTLIADAVGSFHICPYVNCNGGKAFEFMEKDGTRIDREPFIMMNLVLVRVQGVTNDSKGKASNCKSFPAAGQTAANFGGFTTSSGGANWTGPTSGWHAKATVDVIGGGKDGRRGLDHVFGGWIQHIFLNGIRAVYDLPPPLPPAPALAPRSHQYAFISNLPDNTHYGSYHYIGAAEAPVSAADAAMCVKVAPKLDAAPILDVSPFGGVEGTGGDSAVGSNGFQGGTTGPHGGGYAAPTALAIGQRWKREMWDAPGIGCRSQHISAGGTLASFRFNLGFRTDLCFWTNTDLKPDQTATGVANRLYVSVYRCTWTPDFAIRFDPVTGVGTITTAKKIAVTKDKSAATGRAAAVDSLGLETRSPFALAWYAVDART